MSSSKPKPTAKTAVKKKQSKPKSSPKVKFDTEAFVFDTPIEHIEQALERFEQQDADPLAEKFTDQELYYWIVWLNSLPEAKKRGMVSVPVSAVESAVLKLPKDKKK